MLAPWKERYEKPILHIKQQRHHFADIGHYSQRYGFSSSHVRMWELDHKEGWMLLNCGTGEVPWRSNQSILKEIILNFHWKDWGWSWSSNTLATQLEDLTHWKRPWCWERLRAGGKGVTEDETVRQHHQLNGCEFDQTLRDSEGQRILVWCSPVWSRKESDMS